MKKGVSLRVSGLYIPAKIAQIQTPIISEDMVQSCSVTAGSIQRVQIYHYGTQFELNISPCNPEFSDMLHTLDPTSPAHKR